MKKGQIIIEDKDQCYAFLSLIPQYIQDSNTVESLSAVAYCSYNQISGFKNPAYGRHSISRPMRIIGPADFFFDPKPPLAVLGEGGGGVWSKRKEKRKEEKNLSFDT